MREVCKVCQKPLKINTFNRELEPYVIQACSLQCVVEFLRSLKPFDKKLLYFQNGRVYPFKSKLEEIFYREVSPYFDLFYEEYVLMDDERVYIPDFYVPKKNVFIEVKGSSERISKFKHFAKLGYPLYIVFPETIMGGDVDVRLREAE